MAHNGAALVAFPTNRPTVWDREVGSYIRACKAAGMSPHTIRSYESGLTGMRSWLVETGRPLDPRETTRADVEAYIEAMADKGLADSTRAQRFICLGAFYKFLASEEEGVIERSPFAGVKRPLVKEHDLAGAVVTAETIAKLLATTAGRAFDQRRDRAILLLMLSTGARRGEVAAIRMEDIDTTAGTVWLRGKGNRERLARFGDDTARAIDQYLRVRDDHPRANREYEVGDRPDTRLTGLPLFLVEAGKGNRGGLGGPGIRAMVRRRCIMAGVPHINPHRFRHTWADAMLATGHQEGDVMRLGGWRDRGMLNRYGSSQADARARRNYHDPVDALWSTRKR